MYNENKRSIKYPLNLQFFAEPTPPADPRNDPSTDLPKEHEKTFTQAELEDIIAKRLERERKKYADYDDLKAKLTDYERAEEERKKAAMTEKERLETEKAEALKKAEEFEKQAKDVLTKANQRLIKAEFRAIARELGIRQDALDDAFVLADLSTVEVDDDGNVKGIKEVVDLLIKNKPFLVEVKKESKQIGGPTGGSDDKPQKTKEQMLKEAFDKAKKSGRLEDQAAYAKLKRELGL